MLAVAVTTGVVCAILVILAVFVAPKLGVYLQPFDRIYNFEHYAQTGEAHMRTQTPLGIV